MLVAGIAAGSVVWLTRSAGQSWLAGQIGDRLGGLLEAGDISVARIHLTLTEIRLEGLVVRGPAGRSVLAVPEIRAVPRWPGLLAGHVELVRVDVVAPDLVLGRADDGGFDLPVVASSGASAPGTYLPEGWSLGIEELALERGRVALPDDGVRVDRAGLTAALSVDHTTVAAELDVSSEVGEPGLGLVEAGGGIRLDGVDLASLRADLAVLGAELGLQGSLEGLLDGARGALAADVTGTADAAARTRLASVLGVELPEALTGAPPLSARLTARGRRSDADVQATVGWGAAAGAEAADALTMSARGPLDPPWQLTVEARAPSLVAWAEPLGLPAVEGAVGVSGTVQATDPSLDDLRAVLDVTAERLAIEGVTIRQARIPATVARAGEGWTVRGEGGLVEQLAASAGPVRADRLTVDYRLGAPTPLVSTVTVRTDAVDVGVADNPLPLAGAVDVNVRGEVVRLRADLADRRTGHGRVQAAATVALGTGRVDIGELALELVPEVTWTQVRPTSLTITEDGAVTGLQAALQSERGRVTVDGTRISGAHQDLRAIVYDLDLAHVTDVAERFAPGTLPALEGLVRATVSVRTRAGEAPRYLVEGEARDLVVEGQLVDMDLVVQAGIEQDRGTAEVTLEHDGVLVFHGAVSTPLAPSALALACGATGADVAFELAPVAWETLRRRLPPLPELPSPVDGPLTVALTGTAEGDPCDPRIRLDAAVDAVIETHPVRLEVSGTDGPDVHALEGAFTARLEGAGAATGHYRVAHAAPRALYDRRDTLGVDALDAWEASLQVGGFPLSVLGAGAPGEVAGWAKAAGAADTVQSTTGGLQWAAGDALDIPATAQARWSTVGDRIEATADLVLPDGQGAEAEAAVSLAALQRDGAEAPLEARVTRAELGLAQLAALTDGQIVDAAGVLRVGGTVGGTVGQPDANLEAVLKDGALTARDTGVRYEGIELRARSEGRRLVLERAELRSRPRYGRFGLAERRLDLSATGSLAMTEEGLAPDLTVQLDRFWVSSNDSALLRASGQLTLSGRQGRSQVLGQIEIGEGRFDLGRGVFLPASSTRVHPDIRFVDAPAEDAVADADTEAPSMLDLVDVAVQVDLGTRGVDLKATVPLAEQRDLVGKASDVTLDGKVGGSLRVRREDGEIDVQGRVEATGAVRLLTARFDVEEGTLAFAGGDPLSPAVDFRLRRDSNAYGAVTARVTGTPEDLTVSSLQSDEYEDQTDVIALLLLGRPLSTLDPDQGQSAEALVSQALYSIAGAQLEQAIGTELVDSIRYTSEGGLAVGWSIGNNAFLTVSYDPLAEENENATEAKLSWFLGPRVEADFSTGNTGASGGWILWKRRF